MEKGLIVSCQALAGNPLRDSETIARMAAAAGKGGAVALRINGEEDIRAVTRLTDIPIIGINKKTDETGRTVITPDFESARQVAKAGASVIALDVTDRRFRETDIPTLIRDIKTVLKVEVMADISTLEEAERAAKAGADYISTTLAGYVEGALYPTEEKYVPNLGLIKSIIERLPEVRVVGEGRFWRPEQLEQAFALGVHAVVIGKAITNPTAITEYFVSHIKKYV